MRLGELTAVAAPGPQHRMELNRRSAILGTRVDLVAQREHVWIVVKAGHCATVLTALTISPARRGEKMDDVARISRAAMDCFQPFATRCILRT